MRSQIKNLTAVLFSIVFMLLGSTIFNPALAGCPPDGQAVCELYHPGSTLTGGCEGPDCFSMAYAELVRGSAVDDQGLFPKKWHLWFPKGEAVLGSYLSCDLKEKDGKLEVQIPETDFKCRFEVLRTLTGVVYHEHFVANTATSCLAWIECRSQ